MTHGNAAARARGGTARPDRHRRRAACRAGPAAVVLGLALAGASAASAAAPEVYGRAHLAFTAIDDGADYASYNLSSNSSRIGLRGRHAVRDALTALYQIEGDVLFDTTDDGFDLSSRNTFLGLRGDFGTVRAGRFDTPAKRIVNNTAQFRDQVGDSRNIVRNATRGGVPTTTGFDQRFRNAVGYATPDAHPWQVELAYATDTEQGTAPDGNPNDAYSGTLTYRMGPVYAAVGHERWAFENDPDRRVTRAGAWHDWGALRVALFHQRASNPDDDAWGVGTRYRLADDLAVKAAYYALRADDDALDAEQYAVGAEFQASDALMFYVSGAVLSNGEAQELSPWDQGSSLSRDGGGAARLADERARAVAVGTVYRF